MDFRAELKTSNMKINFGRCIVDQFSVLPEEKVFENIIRLMFTQTIVPPLLQLSNRKIIFPNKKKFFLRKI